MDLRPALQHHFGLPGFRPGQEEAVRAVLAGRDALVVMPTGAGKSLCYQLPALLRPDLTLVVSPLVSLMADQVAALERRVPGRAALISGQQDAATNAAALAAAASGRLRLLYVAPERFAAPGFAGALAGVRVGLFVVDEAHCVSTWGHDFRPSYLGLRRAARAVGARTVMACTATATPTVAADVCARLGLRDPVRVATGYDRPALSFAVGRVAGEGARARAVAAALAAPGATPAIVYAPTRRACEDLALSLTAALGRPVAAYHAGLARRVRAAVQARFTSGAADVVVATSAFGMGIDKADVRTVVHAGAPPTLEAYYQEAGRAGRDGRPAHALLLVTPADRERAERRTRSHAAAAAASRAGRSPARSSPSAASGSSAAPDPAAATAAMWAFVDGRGCRRRALLAHFGDTRPPVPAGPCCDACDPVLRIAPARLRPLPAAPPPSSALDAAITATAAAARPPLDADGIASVLRGTRTRALRRGGYDGLPAYGTFGHLAAAAIAARVRVLAAGGQLEAHAGSAVAPAGGPAPAGASAPPTALAPRTTGRRAA